MQLMLLLALAYLLIVSGDFNPGVFDSKADPQAIYQYVNDPVVVNATRVVQALPDPSHPGGLLHQPPPQLSGNTVVGLATYSFFMSGFQRLVGSLRVAANFTGNIILGVSPDISTAELGYLKSMDVTLYTIEVSDCDSRFYGPGVSSSRKKDKDKRVGGGLMRGRCVKGLEHLKIEMARFELARQWLHACPNCDGWALVMDTRDVIFQSDPLAALGDPSTAFVNLLFIEEISPHTSPIKDPRRSFVAGNSRSNAHTTPCYGHSTFDTYAQRPVLNSGTVIGTRAGIQRFLSVLVDEFTQKATRSPNKKCRSPFTTDQWTMNWLYYNGRFGEVARTATMPWGLGPVLTLGKACVGADRRMGASDIVQPQQPRGGGGGGGLWILNRFTGQPAAVVHQWDRCGEWVREWMRSRPDLFLLPAREVPAARAGLGLDAEGGAEAAVGEGASAEEQEPEEDKEKKR